MGMNITLISHKVNVLKRLEDCIYDAMDEMVGDGVDDSPIIEWVQNQMLYGYHDPHGKDGHTEIYDTGFMSEKSLRASAKRDSQNTYTISAGSTAPYAGYVHNGTHKLKARPFLVDALEKNNDKAKAIYEKHLKHMSDP